MPSMTPGGDPKAPLAVETWRTNAAAIEAHLAFRGIDIADWHTDRRDEHGRLVLSSRRLLVLLEHIPETGGKWPMALKVAAKSLKEAALHRASLFAGGPNEYEPEWFIDPQEALELIDKAEAEEADFEAATDEFYDHLDFT